MVFEGIKRRKYKYRPHVGYLWDCIWCVGDAGRGLLGPVWLLTLLGSNGGVSSSICVWDWFGRSGSICLSTSTGAAEVGIGILAFELVSLIPRLDVFDSSPMFNGLKKVSKGFETAFYFLRISNICNLTLHLLSCILFYHYILLKTINT